jgi:hypothetical protein
MKMKKNPKLLDFILTELNKNGVNVRKGTGLTPYTTCVGSRSKKMHLKYPEVKDK